MKLNMENHVYEIVNSCNGLLCLSNPSNNDLVIVCNPITGEFIDLPEVRTINHHYSVSFLGRGFGFSPATNQYKVIRTFICRSELNRVIMAEVHTLGLPCSVTCFDIEKECFESISLPPFDFTEHDVRMGILGEELFISASQYYDVHFWAMMDNGAMKSWSKIYPFMEDDDFDDDEGLPHGSYRPIKYLNNTALLMFNLHQNALICKDTRKSGFKYLKVTAGFDVIPHIPSFVPLKHALSGNIVKVLHVKSRGAELKLHNEDQGISIVEEDFD